MVKMWTQLKICFCCYPSRPIIVTSSEEECLKELAYLAGHVIIVDFPAAIQTYNQCKYLAEKRNLQQRVTSFLNGDDQCLMPDLGRYLIQKDVQVPVWVIDCHSLAFPRCNDSQRGYTSLATGIIIKHSSSRWKLGWKI